MILTPVEGVDMKICHVKFSTRNAWFNQNSRTDQAKLKFCLIRPGIDVATPMEPPRGPRVFAKGSMGAIRLSQKWICQPVLSVFWGFWVDHKGSIGNQIPANPTMLQRWRKSKRSLSPIRANGWVLEVFWVSGLARFELSDQLGWSLWQFWDGFGLDVMSAAKCVDSNFGMWLFHSGHPDHRSFDTLLDDSLHSYSTNCRDYKTITRNFMRPRPMKFWPIETFLVHFSWFLMFFKIIRPLIFCAIWPVEAG
jgi:hypothetical protein